MPQGVNLYKVDAENNRIRVTDVAALLTEKTMDTKEKKMLSVKEKFSQLKGDAEKIEKEKTVKEKQRKDNTSEDSYKEKTPFTNDEEKNEMNIGVGTKDDKNFSEKSYGNDMEDKNEKVLKEFEGDELSNLDIDNDVEDDKLKEFSETSSQMIEKIKDILVSEEDNLDENNAGDSLMKEGDINVTKMKENDNESKEGKTTRRKTRRGGRKRKKINND